MESKPALWDKHSEVLQPLRLPKCKPKIDKQKFAPTSNELIHSQLTTSNSNNVKKESDIEDIIARSTLKVDAPEWYPSSCIFNNRAQSSTSINNGHDVKNVTENNKSNFRQYYERSEDSSDITRLKQIISTLTKDPGQFDNLLDLFMETIQPYFEDIMALSFVSQLLVEQAITNSNFRYTGARLCLYVEQNCPEFRAELHLKCKKQLEDNINKQNVLLFIAELYIQLPHLTIYGALLIDCYKQLLRDGHRDNIKCICQALKLTGHSLEHSNKSELDEVFDQLKSTKQCGNGTVINLVNAISDLRTSNWGYSNENSNDIDNAAETFYCEGLQSTTFYRTDGDTFTKEEREFLSAHLDSNSEYFSDNSDPDELCDPEPEMDDEIQAAFKEFVQLSKH